MRHRCRLGAAAPRAAGQTSAPAGPSAALPNYDLAAQWTTQKVSKLVFDTSVTPRWLDTGDRFWYSFQTREGRRFYLVDPVKKSRTPLFDHAKMAAALTTITRIPYDAQNLPFSTVRFVKKDTSFEFNFQVPASAVIPSTKPRELTTEQQGETRGRDDLNDAGVDPQQQGGRQGGRGGRGASGDAPAPPRNKTLYFEYDMATARVTLLEDFKPEPRQLRWASMSPDSKTVLFARNHNLYMMDAESYAKALKNPNDTTIVEVQLTTDGEDFYGFSSRSGGRGNQDDLQQQQQHNNNKTTNSSRNSARTSTPRTRGSRRLRPSGRATRASSRSCAATSAWSRTCGSSTRWPIPVPRSRPIATRCPARSTRRSPRSSCST